MPFLIVHNTVEEKVWKTIERKRSLEDKFTKRDYIEMI